MDKMLAYMFIAIQIGLGVGPFIGSFFYSLLHHNMFFAILIITVINSLIFIPSAHFMLNEERENRMALKTADQDKAPQVKRLATTV